MLLAGVEHFDAFTAILEDAFLPVSIWCVSLGSSSAIMRVIIGLSSSGTFRRKPRPTAMCALAFFSWSGDSIDSIRDTASFVDSAKKRAAAIDAATYPVSLRFRLSAGIALVGTTPI